MKRTGLAVAVLALLSVPVLQSQQNLFKFEVATVKANNATSEGNPARGCRGMDTTPDPRPDRVPIPLGRCLFERASLDYLIVQAYFDELGAVANMPPQEIVTGGPDWIHSEKFDIAGKAADPSTATHRDLSLMLQSLLADRFKLKLRQESKEVSGYTMVLAKNGPKLVTARDTGIPSAMQGRTPSPGMLTIVGQNASMDGIARLLSTLGIGPVVNKTDLPKTYDFVLTFELEAGMNPKGAKGGSPVPIQPGTGPSLFTAVEGQLGLRLVSQKVLIQHIVIDEVSEPTEN